MYLVLYESIRTFCQHVYSLAIDILSGKVDIHTQCVEMSGSIPRNVACRLRYSDIMFCDTGSLVPFMTFTFKQTLEPQCFLSNLLFSDFISWSHFVYIKRYAVASFPGLSTFFDCLQYANTVSQTLDVGYRNNHWNTSPSGDTQMCMSLHSVCSLHFSVQ